MNKAIVAPKTFLTYSLGCRTNQAEIENTSLQLMDYGLQQIENGLRSTDNRLQQRTPDIILLNTCVVTAKAERETRKEIRKLRRLYPKSYLIVMGCAADAKEKLNIVLPEADLLIPNPKKEQALQLILTRIKHPLKHLNFTHDRESLYNVSKFNKYFLSGRKFNKYQFSGRKFIKIQEGCGRFCSYCITTFLRGKPKSVPKTEVVKEINFWVKNGIKEIILTGINVALYGTDLNIDIVFLLNSILKETSAERISFSSIYPEMLTKDFLNLVIKNSRITRCFHLSLQSGSPIVLKRMNRNTNINELTNYLLFIKKAIPEFTLRADFIAGFPDETEKEFNETLDLIKKLRISFVHVFPFSKRVGTLAYKMKDLPPKIKVKRSKKIMEVVKKIRNNEARKMIGKVLPCLIIKKVASNYETIANNSWPVKIKAPLRPSASSGLRLGQGKILPVKITKFENDQLFGEILSLPI